VVTRGVVVMADVDLVVAQVVIVVSLVTLVTVECKVIVVWILACQNQQGHLIMSDFEVTCQVKTEFNGLRES